MLRNMGYMPLLPGRRYPDSEQNLSGMGGLDLMRGGGTRPQPPC